MITTNSTIIIYLNKQLQIYSFQKAVNKLTVLKILESDRFGRLELADKFMDLWLELQNWLENTNNQVVFWIGPKAGFTDTRVIFVWLKTKWLVQKFFDQKFRFFLMRVDFNSLVGLDESIVQKLLELSQIQTNKQLPYSAQPRIGVSKNDVS